MAALHAAVSKSDEPAVVIAHSAGCITTAVWATHHTGPVHAALLVTPPYIDGAEPDDPSDIPWVMPRNRLPFRAVLVASRTDPYTTFAQFEQLAQDWDAQLVDAGDVGHLDTATGFGGVRYGKRVHRRLKDSGLPLAGRRGSWRTYGPSRDFP